MTNSEFMHAKLNLIFNGEKSQYVLLDFHVDKNYKWGRFRNFPWKGSFVAPKELADLLITLTPFEKNKILIFNQEKEGEEIVEKIFSGLRIFQENTKKISDRFKFYAFKKTSATAPNIVIVPKNKRKNLF